MKREPRVKRSFSFSKSTLEQVEKVAVQNDCNTSEMVREYVKKGLTLKAYEENIDMIRTHIREEIEIGLEEFNKETKKQVERIIKMIVKLGKVSAGEFFLLIKLLENLTDDDSTLESLYDSAVGRGINYMKIKDDKVNEYLKDYDSILSDVEKIVED